MPERRRKLLWKCFRQVVGDGCQVRGRPRGSPCDNTRLLRDLILILPDLSLIPPPFQRTPYPYPQPFPLICACSSTAGQSVLISAPAACASRCHRDNCCLNKRGLAFFRAKHSNALDVQTHTHTNAHTGDGLLFSMVGLAVKSVTLPTVAKALPLLPGISSELQPPQMKRGTTPEDFTR